MAKYIVKRMLIAILTFLGITVLVYVLASLASGESGGNDTWKY